MGSAYALDLHSEGGVEGRTIEPKAHAPAARAERLRRKLALSDKEPAVRLAVVASDHEQSVPIFQQLAGGHPSGRDDVRSDTRCHCAKRRSISWPSARIDISHETVRVLVEPLFGPMFAAEIRKRRVAHLRGYPQWRWHLDGRCL